MVGTSSMAAVNIMINNRSNVNAAGAINGFAASCAALTRLIAPAAAGSLFAASATVDKFPFDFHFVFFVLSLMVLASFLITFLLSKDVNERKELLLKEYTQTELEGDSVDSIDSLSTHDSESSLEDSEV